MFTKAHYFLEELVEMIDCIPHLHFMLLHMHLLYFRYVNILPTIIIIMKKDIIV